MPPTVLRNLALFMAALALGACADSTVTSPASRNVTAGRPAFSLAAGKTKVQVCHRTDNGTFILITVGAPAVPAHLDHGDGFPGELVPGRTDGSRFATDCSIITVINPS
ncbi:MAG: hypothetical protein ACYCVL_07815 [Gemmatimonadaceae bacterium]